MTDQLISFKTAKLAKEKGFDKLVYACYNNSTALENLNNIWSCGCEGGMHLEEWYYNYNAYPHNTLYSAPTQSLLQKWLREEHNLSIEIACTIIKDWFFEIYKISSGNRMYKAKAHFKTYEEALEVGLQEGLKQIK